MEIFQLSGRDEKCMLFVISSHSFVKTLMTTNRRLFFLTSVRKHKVNKQQELAGMDVKKASHKKPDKKELHQHQGVV